MINDVGGPGLGVRGVYGSETTCPFSVLTLLVSSLFFCFSILHTFGAGVCSPAFFKRDALVMKWGFLVS